MNELTKKAWEIRLELLRMFSHGKFHHFGGSLSCVELITALYFHKMNYSAKNASDPQRDRFIISKGHAVPIQYIVLAQLGIIPQAELKTIKQLGTRLQGHPDIRKTPGIEAPTGSLGQGLSFANGISLAARMDGLKFNIYLILGDGELQEGQVWEAAMTTTHYKLNNTCVIIDRNRFQSQGEVDKLMGVEPLEAKWKAFGWKTARIDGHDLNQICQTLDSFTGSQPMAIIADTVKGKGVSFMENTYKYHNSQLTEAEYHQVEQEIIAKINAL